MLQSFLHLLRLRVVDRDNRLQIKFLRKKNMLLDIRNFISVLITRKEMGGKSKYIDDNTYV
jgi:hypothetical protein